MQNTSERKDVYSRITAQIVEYLREGVRPWTRPWNAEHAAGRITRPLRHNGQPYSGINVLSLWMSGPSPEFCRPYLDDLPPGQRVKEFKRGSDRVPYCETDKAAGHAVRATGRRCLT